MSSVLPLPAPSPRAAAAAPAAAAAATPSAALTSSLLQLHAVFTHLDSISPSHPASGAITLPKLKEALSIYAQWTFPDDEEAGGPHAAGAAQEAAEELQRRRRRRREEREQLVRDMIAAVDLNRNGKIELPEFIKLMEEQPATAAAEQANDEEGDSDDDWTPTRENIRLVFDTFDKDRDGFISFDELKAALRSQGIDHLTDDDIRQMMLTVDEKAASKAGVSLAAFTRLMSAGNEAAPSPAPLSL